MQREDAGLCAEWYFHRKVYCLLGVPIDAVRSEEVIATVRRASESGLRLTLLTPNVNDIVQSQFNGAFRDAFLTSDISLADGMPVVWLGRFLGLPISQRLAGADLFDRLQEGRAGKMTVFFYGGADGMAALARQKINQAGGALRCVGDISPGFGSLEELSKPEQIDEVNRAAPDLLVVSLGKHGKPWIVKNASKIKKGIIAHLGAVINFTAGTVRRAPKGLQQVGLEWAWRILQEPVLFRRYYRDARALAWLLVQRVFPLKLQQLRFRVFPQEDRGAELHVSYSSDEFTFQLRGAWTGSSLDSLRSALLRASKQKAGMTFDLSMLRYMDSAVVGVIILCYGWQLRNARSFRISKYSKVAARILEFHCCRHLLQIAATYPLPALAPTSEILEP